jgi:hypothetical protein
MSNLHADGAGENPAAPSGRGMDCVTTDLPAVPICLVVLVVPSAASGRDVVEVPVAEVEVDIAHGAFHTAIATAVAAY